MVRNDSMGKIKPLKKRKGKYRQSNLSKVVKGCQRLLLQPTLDKNPPLKASIGLKNRLSKVAKVEIAILKTGGVSP